MRSRMLAAALLGISAFACKAAPDRNSAAAVAAVPAQGVILSAADGLRVHGLYYAAPKPKALILLFHQAGSSKAEYTTIAPRLRDAGYSSLAIDQRSGGDMFGSANETVGGLGRSTDYLSAIPDLESAIAWARTKRLPIILWGSSYSSALVFPVAARHAGEIAAVLAFSPGEYLDGRSVKDAAKHLRAPLFVTSASDPQEIAAAKEIAESAPVGLKVQFIPIHGVHGSSTLIPARNAAGAEENWRAVLEFLSRLHL